MTRANFRIAFACLGLMACALPLSAQDDDANDYTDPNTFVFEEDISDEYVDDYYDEYERPDIEPIGDARLDQLLDPYKDNPEFQTERPVPEPVEPFEFTPRERSGFWSAIADFLAGVIKFFGNFIVWILLACVVGGILYALYLMFGDGFSLSRRKKEIQAGPLVSELDDFRPEETAAAALLEDADALAAKGLFGEAVHLLLFRSIDDIQAKRGRRIPKALTAREIGNLPSLPERVRTVLSPIIRTVERSFFGGRPVDETGWKSARASYTEFAFGEAWT